MTTTVCNKCGHDPDSGWVWWGYVIVWLTIFFFLWWALFVSVKPPIVMDTTTNTPDMVKVTIGAAIAAPLTLLFVYGIKWIVAYVKG